MTIPVAVRSKAWVSGLSIAGIAGSNPTGACCVGGVLCDGSIIRPGESYQVCVSHCVIKRNSDPLHLQWSI